jgi:hypothetical protein
MTIAKSCEEDENGFKNILNASSEEVGNSDIEARAPFNPIPLWRDCINIQSSGFVGPEASEKV